MHIRYFLMMWCIVFGFAGKGWTQSRPGQPGRTDCSISVEGVERSFIVYMPAGPFPKPMPVVFMFHGTSGFGERFFNISGWKEKADQTGLIAVFPSSLPYCVDEGEGPKHTTKWNDGKLQHTACPGQELRDDVLFFREMVRYLEQHYPIDRRRIYASGFSNGGNFVSRLALEAGDLLAGANAFAGILQDTSFIVKGRIPMYLAIGDQDIAKHLGKLPIWNEQALHAEPLFGLVSRMVRAWGLGLNYRFEQSDSLLTYIFRDSTNQARPEFRFSIVKDLPHRYPNGRNHPMTFSSLLWDYFSRWNK